MRKHRSRLFSADEGETLYLRLESKVSHKNFVLSSSDVPVPVTGRGRWRVKCTKPDGREHHTIRLRYRIDFPPGSSTDTQFVLSLWKRGDKPVQTTFIRPQNTEDTKTKVRGDIAIGVS